MKLWDNAKDWVFNIAAKKVISRLVVLLIARLAAVETAKYGVSISLDADQLTTVIFGGLEMLRGYLKQKGWAFL